MVGNAWLVLVVAMTFVHSTAGISQTRYSYNRRPSYSTNRYKLKPSKAYPATQYLVKPYSKKKTTALTTIMPLCHRGTIWLSVFVVKKEDGKPIKDAMVQYVDGSNNIEHVYTDNYGVAKLKVTGCKIGIFVSSKGRHFLQERVDLTSCTSPKKNYMVQLDAACDFVVNIINKCCDVDPGNKISYMWSSGGASGQGTAVAGGAQNHGFLCLGKVSVGDHFKLTIGSQQSSLINVLETTVVHMGNELLPHVKIISPAPPFIFDEPMGLVATPNVWASDDTVSDETISYTAVVLDQDDQSYSYEDNGYCINVPRESITQGNNYLIAFRIDTTGNTFQGNVYIVDWMGNSISVQITPADFTNGYYWLVGCVCGGDLGYFTKINTFVASIPTSGNICTSQCWA